MNVDTMRWMDRAVAGTACALLRPAAALLRRLDRVRAREPRRILAIKFFGLGSLLRALPLFTAIRARHPHATIDLLTFRANEPFLRRFGLIDSFLTVDPSGLRVMAGSLAARTLQIFSARYDAVIDMEFFSNLTGILTLLTRAPIRIGFYQRRSVRESLYNRIVFYNPAHHVTEVFLALARELDAPPAPPPPIPLLAEERQRADQLLAQAGISPVEPLVVINPNASDLSPERRWPADRFAELAAALRARGAAVVLIGTPSERDHVARISERSGAVNLAGRTDVGTLAALLARARLVVANDSGPAHIADLLDVPTIVLYGPESPAHYGVRGPRSVRFHLGLYCSPCLNALNMKVAPCRGRNVCMTAIPLEPVLQAALTLLEGRAIAAEDRRRWDGFHGRLGTYDWRSGIPEPVA